MSIFLVRKTRKKMNKERPSCRWVVVSAHEKNSVLFQGRCVPFVLQVSLSLEKGIGVSLINSVPEELIFASVTGIRVEYVHTSVHQCVNATVQYIQVGVVCHPLATPISLAFPFRWIIMSSEATATCSFFRVHLPLTGWSATTQLYLAW